jgi:hypothetical protein
VEEGVAVPAGSQVGFDLEDDRTQHVVTDAGIVVSDMPKHARQLVALGIPERIS